MVKELETEENRQGLLHSCVRIAALPKFKALKNRAPVRSISIELLLSLADLNCFPNAFYMLGGNFRKKEKDNSL